MCFSDAAATNVSALSLHGALPISERRLRLAASRRERVVELLARADDAHAASAAARGRLDDQRRLVDLRDRSEEHTSELQSRRDLVCGLLLANKNKHKSIHLSPV